MLSSLYSDMILQAAANIPPARRLERPSASARRVSRICGSEIGVDLLIEDGIVRDIGLEAQACALGQAAASIVANNIVGAPVGELLNLRDEMRAMLKQGAPPPAGERWSALAALQSIRDYPQRHTSTLLVFDAVCDCIEATQP